MDGRRLHGAEKEKWRSVWPLKFSRKEVKRPKSGFRKNYLEGGDFCARVVGGKTCKP
jgi:hypothetical protein